MCASKPQGDTSVGTGTLSAALSSAPRSDRQDPRAADHLRRVGVGVSDRHVLLGDIGATNARFAVLSGGFLGPIQHFSVSDFPRFTDAVAAFLERCSAPVQAAAIAVAGPIEKNRCVLTNSSWIVDAAELASEFGISRTLIRNDFEATAFALPHLGQSDLHRVGAGEADTDAPAVVLGPGTGLGVACLAPGNGGSPVVIASEGGHATFPASSRREDAILEHMRRAFGHVSAERVISGPGLENLYAAIVAVEGLAAPPRDAAAITSAALAGDCAAARDAVDTFCAMLGTFAGNMALTFGARGGVFIAGGIAPRILQLLTASEFRTRFESKGRFRPYLTAIPTSVIVHPAATFLGLQSILLTASNRKAAVAAR
ncbi:MAG: glucokinase [Proteobacteria bacterium]|nr:MAG: glucokinase [Pseudomonadota bacterium]